MCAERCGAINCDEELLLLPAPFPEEVGEAGNRDVREFEKGATDSKDCEDPWPYSRGVWLPLWLPPRSFCCRSSLRGGGIPGEPGEFAECTGTVMVPEEPKSEELELKGEKPPLEEVAAATIGEKSSFNEDWRGLVESRTDESNRRSSDIGCWGIWGWGQGSGSGRRRRRRTAGSMARKDKVMARFWKFWKKKKKK